MRYLEFHKINKYDYEAVKKAASDFAKSIKDNVAIYKINDNQFDICLHVSAIILNKNICEKVQFTEI